MKDERVNPHPSTLILHPYLCLLDAFRFSSAQPVGSTAAAAMILMTSPTKNGATPALKALRGVEPNPTTSQAQPARRITADPTAIAATAVRNRRSQPCSEKAPVMYAAAGNDTR